MGHSQTKNSTPVSSPSPQYINASVFAEQVGACERHNDGNAAYPLFHLTLPIAW